jgi:branched-chain amino acid transport system permease protein
MSSTASTMEAAPGEPAPGKPAPGKPPADEAPPRAPIDILGALRDAGFSALIALGLFGMIMGLKTVQGARGLVIVTEWDRVFWAVAIVFVGRLALNFTIWREGPKRSLGSLLPVAISRHGSKVSMLLGGTLIALALTLPFLPGTGRYHIDLGTLVLTYVMLGWGLNIVVGLAGLLDLGYVAFYAVGAYSYALLSTYYGLSFWICLPLAGVLDCFWGVILGFPVLRLRGDYLAIVTLAFGEIIRVVLLNWSEFSGGPNGIGNIPRPSFFGLEFTRGEGGFAETFGLTFSTSHRLIFLYYLILVLAFLTHFVTVRLRRLPIGRAWEAMREDEIACRSLGLSIVRTKLTAFAIGAGFGGLAGAFFATRQGFISPESFTFIESALILAIVVLGGMGSQLGVAIAALVMIGGFEYFRDLEQFRMLAFGGMMVLIMVWRPRGLISSRMPSVFLKTRTRVGSDMVGEGKG